MCITRVGKVRSVSGGVATVRFFDQREVSNVVVSVLENVKVGGFVEVYGNLALSVLTPVEAKRRESAWREVRNAALMPPVQRKVAK